MGKKTGRGSVLERGQGMAEYGMILILVGVVVIVVVSAFGKTVQKKYCGVVYSIDANASVPLCEAIDVDCDIQSTSPFRMAAVPSDNAGDSNITRVDWYVDGSLYNTEVYPQYCLQGGDSDCAEFTGGSGSHTVRAVAFDADGNVGECTATVNVP